MFFKKYKIVGPSLVILSLLVALAAHSIFIGSSAKAFAHITVEVNPEITITVDSNEKVIAVELQNADAKQIFSEETLLGKNVDEALRLIADGLDKNGFLSDDNQLFFIVQPAEGVKKEDLSGVSERILVTLKAELKTREAKSTLEIVLLDSNEQKVEQNAQTTVSTEVSDTNIDTLSDTAVNSESTAEVININDPITWNRVIKDAYNDMLAAGFTAAEALDILKNASLVNPEYREIYEIASGFVDMKDVGIPYLVSKTIFEMGQGLDQKLFQEEISTLISDLIDMHEVGISLETGLKALTLAIGADHSLMELSTIISGIIDLKEAGIPEAELLTRATRAVEADPTLRGFEDLLETNDGQDNDSYTDDQGNGATDDNNSYDEHNGYDTNDSAADNDDNDDNNHEDNSDENANDSDDDNDADDDR